jgi:lipid A ethanolaminephosphotransferase
MALLSLTRARFKILHDAVPFSPIALTVLTAIFVFCFYNSTFWSIGAEIFTGHVVSFLAFILAVFFLLLAFFSLFGLPWIVKPFLAFIVILSAVTSYYVDSLGVIIDRDMIQNIMVTTFTESKHLITFGFVSHVVIYGVLPALMICAVRIKPQTWLRTFGVPVLTLILSLTFSAGLLFSDYKTYASILRERKDFMSSFQPGAPIVGTIRYAKMMARSNSMTVAAIGEDAHLGASYDNAPKPVLMIVVSGETARSQNFSLNGYGVQTNPRLAELPVISFSDVNSCGTATAVSLPCMFSHFTRDTYSFERGVSTQNVLDVMSHAGLHVEWWDNNTGDKGLADRIVSRSFTHSDNAELCASGECMDGIFLQVLSDYADTITQDTVLVLHQIGSHGPTYYLRYPEEFERFTPACRTAEFMNCTAEEITNAYDNTIAYTDEILAQAIDMLQSREGLSTALLYVSDHGESLGEGGMYLHGAPYFMAPENQTKVPMIVWMSQVFQDQFNIEQNCLNAIKDTTMSHDNLFHSLLGMLDIQTSEHEPALDIFSVCKTARESAQL